MTPGELHQELFDEWPTAYAVLDLMSGELHFWKLADVPWESVDEEHANYLRRFEGIYEMLVQEQIDNGLTASEIDVLDLRGTAALMARERVLRRDVVIVETWKAPATASKTPGALRAWRTRQLRLVGVTWDGDKNRPNPEHVSWRMFMRSAWEESDQLTLAYANQRERHGPLVLNDGIDVMRLYDRDKLEESLRHWDERAALLAQEFNDEEGG